MFIVLDLETTGLNPATDGIIEYAFIRFDRKTFVEVERLTGFVNPGKDIPAFIKTLTHIEDEDLVGKPYFSEIQDEIQDFIGGYPLVGHNIAFDLSFLRAGGIDLSKNLSIDTFHLANFLCFDLPSLNLGSLCEYFSLELSSAHRAMDDTLATLELFRELIERLKLIYGEYQDIYETIFARIEHSGFKLIYDTYLRVGSESQSINQEGLSRRYKTLLKDAQVALRAGETELTSDHHNNLELFTESQVFEPRESQKTMIDIIDNGLRESKKIMIEAPTGTGKTFGYLVPAIHFSTTSGKQVCISTSTKILQDQLCEKDLPLLKKLGYHFSATKLKGKRNYLSPARLIEFIYREEKLSPQVGSFVCKLFFWSLKSTSGELDELQLYGEEFSLIHEVHAGVRSRSCEEYFGDTDFYQHARKKAEVSDIIITNTSVLVQDMLGERTILGGVEHMIIDEAHSLEDIVTSASESRLSLQKVEKCMSSLEHILKKMKIHSPDFLKEKDLFLGYIDEIFYSFGRYLSKKIGTQEKYRNILLTEDFFHDENILSLIVEKCLKSGKRCLKILGSLDSEDDVLLRATDELTDILGCISSHLLSIDLEKFIYSLHESYGDSELRINILHTDNFLKETLWSELSSVVLTSATLSLSSDPHFFTKVLGTTDFEIHRLKSEFDYAQQSLLYIPNDLSDVRNNNNDIFVFLERLFTLTQGKTLMLCTAHTTIREVFEKLKRPLEEEGIELLTQALGGSKTRHIEYFMRHPEKSILVGTDSFWQGVDFPGSLLEYLVIHKTPFIAPSDPIFQARSKLFIDPFGGYAIPKAVLKLKQGFGRLIRTKYDTGVIIFLDTRILNSKWGERLYEAFPTDIKVRVGSSQALLDILEKNNNLIKK